MKYILDVFSFIFLLSFWIDKVIFDGSIFKIYSKEKRKLFFFLVYSIIRSRHIVKFCRIWIHIITYLKVIWNDIPNMLSNIREWVHKCQYEKTVIVGLLFFFLVGGGVFWFFFIFYANYQRYSQKNHSIGKRNIDLRGVSPLLMTSVRRFQVCFFSMIYCFEIYVHLKKKHIQNIYKYMIFLICITRQYWYNDF